MAQEIITYIVIALAVIIAIRKLIAGIVRKKNKGARRDKNITNRDLPAGCPDCSSKCTFYKDCTGNNN